MGEPFSTPKSYRLAKICHCLAEGDEWESYEAGKDLDISSLVHECAPDDSDPRRWELNFVPNPRRPYINPEAAELYRQRCSVERTLVDRALAWLDQNHWRATVRRPTELSPLPVSYTELAEQHLEIGDHEISVDGVTYVDLRFERRHADTFADLVDVIRAIAPRMDPQIDIAEDFQGAVHEATGRQFVLTQIQDAMRQAGVPPEHFNRGRRRGRVKKRK